MSDNTKQDSGGTSHLKWLLMISVVVIIAYSAYLYYEERLCWDYTPYVLGYFFAGVIGQSAIHTIRGLSWATFNNIDKAEGKPRVALVFGSCIGRLECLAYVTAFLAKQFAFLPVWLAAKVGISWKRWGADNIGRAVANAYLFHNLLSITYAFVGWFMIKNLSCRSHIAAVIAMPIGLVFASWYLCWLLSKKLSKWEREVIEGIKLKKDNENNEAKSNNHPQ